MASTPAPSGGTPPAVAAPLAVGVVAPPVGAITGLNGYIAMLTGASTAAPAEAFEEIPNPPGGSLVLPVHTLFRVTDRTKKVGDSKVKPVVYGGATGTTVIPATNYQWMPGGNYILFYQPLSATDVVKADVNYITTSGANAIYGLVHVLNWQLNMTANPIPGDEYQTAIIPQYRGKMSGTWQFERYSSATAYDLYFQMMTKSHFVFALYESLLENRIWLVYGDIGANPLNAPTNGMIGGTITGTMDAMPSMIVEPI
jgi:hypothetical protein